MTVQTYILTLLMFLFFASGQTDNRRTINTIDADNLVFTNQTKDTIDLNQKIGGRTLKQYFSDEKIPDLFKTVFRGERKLNDDDETLSLIDSLFSKDKDRHPFYFLLVTKTMYWSDGAFSEPLGQSAKEYVENESRQFLNYFKTEKVLTEEDFNNWADYVAGEIGISSENNELQEIENVRKRIVKNCTDCSTEDQKQISKFIDRMKKYNP